MSHCFDVLLVVDQKEFRGTVHEFPLFLMAGLNGLGEAPNEDFIRSEDDPTDAFSILPTVNNGHARRRKKKGVERNGHSPEKVKTGLKSDVAQRLEKKQVAVRDAAAGLLALLRNDDKGIMEFVKKAGKPLDRVGIAEFINSQPYDDEFVDAVMRVYSPDFISDLAAEIEREEEVNAAE